METSDSTIVPDIHALFKKAGLRLSIAESCTGGLISHLLTNVPGASLFLDSAVISYSNEAKIKLLGVSSSLIKKHGAISEEVAQAMARGIRKISGTDFSLSVTGNLGPDPIENKKVGLVYFAVDCEKETTSKGMIFEGSREAIKHYIAISSINYLKEVVEIWK